MSLIVDRGKHDAAAVRRNAVVLQYEIGEQPLAPSSLEICNPEFPADIAPVRARAQQIVEFFFIGGELGKRGVTLRSDLPLAARVVNPQRVLFRAGRGEK